ncbi:DNA cytosine methyltransferase [Cetobacterium sp.]|uniref:DNA cytosine methyltransferase n=1 Tax=Cetobacterium sp. TaxID=2071632 RepID=UPI003F419330
MKILDLFCGAGGMSLGFEKIGFKVTKAIDFSKWAIETYNNNREDKVGECLDIKTLNKDFFTQIEKVDGIIGGPPCQGFSTAGQRIVDDERNELYRDYFEILKWLNPKFFLIENVTGILTFSKGLIKEDIIKRGNQLGYEVFLEVLNASDFGVPQNRKRVFFIGIKKEYAQKIFKFPEKYNTEYLTIEDAISDLPYLYEEKEKTDYKALPSNNYQLKMRGNCKVLKNHCNSAHTEDTKNIIALVPEGGSIKDIPENLRGGRKYKALLRKMDRKKPSFTIDTGHRTYFHYEERRVPTVRESARLQSFPDSFIFLGPKAEQYKQVGNAVPPLLAEEIAKEILKYFK